MDPLINFSQKAQISMRYVSIKGPQWSIEPNLSVFLKLNCIEPYNYSCTLTAPAWPLTLDDHAFNFLERPSKIIVFLGPTINTLVCAQLFGLCPPFKLKATTACYFSSLPSGAFK